MDAAYLAEYPNLYRNHWWWRARERMLLRIIARLLDGLEDVRILDVGCGSGLFLDALEPFGDVRGVESDEASVETSGRWRSRIHNGELTATGDSYDLILLLDVLEHIDEPADLVRTAMGRLSERGYLLATTPAFQFLWTSHDVLNHHVKRYTARGLRQTLERGGLSVIETRYLFPSLVFPKMVAALRDRALSSPPQVPAIPPPALNQFLQRFFAFEDLVAGWMPFGGSVVAIGRRPSAA